MSRPIEFLFDFGSPNAYLVHRAIPAIEARSSVSFEYVPVLLGGIFKETGNQSPVSAFAHIPSKLAYEQLEIERFVARYGIKGFAMNPDFPVNTLLIMRGAVAAQRLGVFARYVDEVFRFMWRDHRRMDDPAIVHATLIEADLPVDELLVMGQNPEIKAELAANTKSAVARGVFGSPTFFVGDEMWFGKERLEDAIRGGLHEPRFDPVSL